MGLFSLDEVFQMAMQAEESGRLLYEAVAKECSDARVAQLCRALAAQELGHYQKFKGMKEAQARQVESRRLSLEETEFTQALIQGRVIPLEAEARRIARENSLAKVLDMAIRAEQGSVAFYSQMLGSVDPPDAAAIGKIIEEEKRHERQLQEVRRTVKD